MRFVSIFLLVLTAAGCATPGEPEFGSSVRHMVSGQTFDPDAGKRAPGHVSGLDGMKAGAAVKAYREEKKESEAPPMTFSFSQK